MANNIKLLLNTGLAVLCGHIKQIRAMAELAGSAALSLTQALQEHADDTRNPHGVTAAQTGALPISGGTLTGNLSGKYITGTWLQGTANNALAYKPPKICVMDSSGWVYSRTPEQILGDIGAQPKIITGSVSIPVSGWVEDGSIPGYAFRNDVPVTGLAASGYIILTAAPASAAAAAAAGLSTADSRAGAFRVYCKKIPPADITAGYVILKGDS